MYTGQLSLSGPFGAADQRATPNSIADVDGNETTFALLFETALGLSDMECSATGASNNPFDTEEDAGGLLLNFSSGGLGTTNGSASFGQLVSQAGRPQVLAVTNSTESDAHGNKAIPVAALNTRAQKIECPAQGVGADGGLASRPSVAGALNKSELSDWMDAHALTRSSHHCAMYCRMGMEAAGLSTADRPQTGDAGDYGPFLLRHGAQTVPQDSYVPQVGDVAVFDKTSQHPFGHIEMYDGHHWVSDFMQHSFSPYHDANSAPPFTIYRFA